MALWDYKAWGKILPAVNDAEILDLIRQGIITGDTEIAKAGTEKWRLVRSTEFRQDCERAQKLNQLEARVAPLAVAAMPEIRTGRVGFAAFIWIVLTAVGLALAWHGAASYDPNKNNTYSIAEAGILTSAWTQVVAQFVSAALLFAVFATFAIVNRLTLIAQVNRAGHLAVVEELRAVRQGLAGHQAATASLDVTS